MSNYSEHISRAEYTKRNKHLSSLLNELNDDPSPQDRTDYYLDKFIEIYIIQDKNKVKDVFRHPYNLLFTLLTDFNGKDSENCDMLTGKIESLLKTTHQKQSKIANKKDLQYDIYGRLANCLFKLWDHISLDISRIQQNQNSIEKIRQPLTNIQNEQQKIESKVKETSIKADSWQKEMIAILGIFSSIILVVAGNLSFSATMFSQVSTTPILSLVIVFCLCGLLFFNSLMILIKVLLERKEREGNNSFRTSCWVVNIILFTTLIMAIILTKEPELLNNIFKLLEPH